MFNQIYLKIRIISRSKILISLINVILITIDTNINYLELLLMKMTKLSKLTELMINKISQNYLNIGNFNPF